MRDYWTCSPFADWIRGTTKLKCGTGKQWAEWEKAAKEKYPIRWWIAEEGLDKIQNVWCWIPERLNDVRYYINNRWVTRSHALTAHPRDIAPGTWRDVGNRFLPCLFNELVDFVEIEQAWHHCVWSNEDKKKYSYPWWRRWYRNWRCPEAGIAYLEWAMTLTNTDWCEPDHPEYGKPTGQALRAKELKELYTWWTTVYPNRPDPYEASGWTEYCEQARILNGGRLFGGKKTPELEELSTRSHELLQKIEAEYEAEDEAMMIRLVKARDSLWT